MILSLTTLKRIERTVAVGDQTLTAIAREYGMSCSNLTSQLKKARDKGILPPVAMGRRKSLVHYCRDVPSTQDTGAFMRP